MAYKQCLFLTVWSLVSPGSRHQQIQCLVMTHFLFINICLFTVSSYGGRSKGALCSFFLIKAQIPFMRAPPSWPNHFPMALPPATITWGLRFQNMSFQGHIQSVVTSSFLSHLLGLRCRLQRGRWERQEKTKPGVGVSTPHRYCELCRGNCYYLCFTDEKHKFFKKGKWCAQASLWQNQTLSHKFKHRALFLLILILLSPVVGILLWVLCLKLHVVPMKLVYWWVRTSTIRILVTKGLKPREMRSFSLKQRTSLPFQQ